MPEVEQLGVNLTRRAIVMIWFNLKGFVRIARINSSLQMNVTYVSVHCETGCEYCM